MVEQRCSRRQRAMAGASVSENDRGRDRDREQMKREAERRALRLLVAFTRHGAQGTQGNTQRDVRGRCTGHRGHRGQRETCTK